MSERSEVIVWEGDSIAAVFDTTPSGKQDAKDFARELAPSLHAHGGPPTRWPATVRANRGGRDE